jgi:hypothetical protein
MSEKLLRLAVEIASKESFPADYGKYLRALPKRPR